MNDIRISGSGTVGSGEYNEVKISGSGRICGDVKCERFAVSGSAHSAGVIECSGELSVSGSLKTDGGVKADSARISGSTAIGGDLCANTLKIAGSAAVSGNCTVTEASISGSIKVGGADIREIPKEELMNAVSFVFQDSKLIKATIAENVKLGKPDATDEEVAAALHTAQCDDIIQKLPDGADTVIGTKGVFLSGGERQRIAIARAVLKNAPVIILDEATAFADPDNEAKVQKAFSELSKGKTVIMIAHRLSTVANADCIYVIKDGLIAESGRRDELLEKNGVFAEMWKEYAASVEWKVAKEA